MDPNNLPTPAPQTPPSGQFDSSQFDFIMNPQQPQKKSLIPGGPMVRKFIMVVGGALLVLVLIIIALGIFTKKDPNVEQVVKIAQEQNEIMRVAQVGNQKAGGDNARQLAALTFSTVSSDQNQTVAYLAKQKRKVKAKELGATASSQTDSDLSNAEQNGRFDEVFTKTLLQELTTYQSDLKSLYGSLGQNGKTLFDQNYNNVTLILTKYQSPTTN